MGWLRNLLGGGQTKEGLVRALAKRRLAGNAQAEAFGATPAAIDSLPTEILAGLPEATIVSIIEAWHQGRQHGIPESQSYDLIEAHRSQVAEGKMPERITLEGYVTYRVRLEHVDGAPLWDEHISHCVQESRAFFGRR